MAWETLYATVSVAIALFCAFQAYQAGKSAINPITGKEDILNKATRFFWVALALYALMLALQTSSLSATSPANTTIFTYTNTTFTYLNFTTNASVYTPAGVLQNFTITNRPSLLYTNQTTNTTQSTASSSGAASLVDTQSVVLQYLLYLLFALFMLSALYSLASLMVAAFYLGKRKTGL